MLRLHRHLPYKQTAAAGMAVQANSCARAKVAQTEQNTKKKELNLQNAHTAARLFHLNLIYTEVLKGKNLFKAGL